MVSNRLNHVSFLVPIHDSVLRVEQKMRAQSDGNHPDLGAALEHLLASGGKRVRPAVALLTGGILGAEQEKLVTLGAAIELLHTATLVHDDLIDGALLRRGMQTLNARWSPAATVLTGDFIFARAAKLAAETDSVAVMRLFAETLAIIVNGELTQLFTSKGLASREDYFQRIYAKTASMFELCTAAAALLSPVGAQEVENMRQMGYNLGMAFQIMDDILDFTGEQATVGKPVASDLRQGLITLPALYYLEQEPEDAYLNAVLHGKLYEDDKFTRLVGSIRASGAIEASLQEAEKYIDCAVETMLKQPDCPQRQALLELANYIIRRDL